MSGGRKGRDAGRGSGRRLAVRRKPSGPRSASSRRWLDRQRKDPYIAEAKRLGFRSRAAFKLIEIDDRFRLLRPGGQVVDLGAAPGGWSQVAAERTGAARAAGRRGRVVAVDSAEMTPLPGAKILRCDLTEADAPARIAEALGGEADVVLSDMAPVASGHAATDHLRSMALAEAAFAVAEAVLAPGGAFIVKLLQGSGERQFLDQLKRRFERVKQMKPPASRKESREAYVVALGFRR